MVAARRAAEPVVDRLAETFMRHRHHGDGGRAGGIERAQMREQIGGGLDQVAARGEVEHARRSAPAGACGAEGEQGLARRDARRVEPQRAARRVV